MAFSAVLMDNKVESGDFVKIESGEMNQTEVTPVVGAGVGEYKTTDPFQAEPLPGDQGGAGDDDTTFIRMLY